MSMGDTHDRRLITSLLKRSIAFLVITGLGCLLTFGMPFSAPARADVPSVYQQRDRPRPDGIGKIYMGREIAQVMGHQGAAWLERPSRSWEEQPQRVVEALDLQPTDVVADIGAGTGYFSFRLSPLVQEGKPGDQCRT